MKFLKALALLAALLPGAALAAGTVQQSGNVTPGHPAMWTTSGVIQDGGSGTNGYLTSLGIFANGGLPECITSSTTARSLFNPSTSPYTQFCMYSTMGAASGFTLNSYNGAGAGGLFYNINGQNVPFPGPGGGTVVGPVSSGNGDVPIFNGTSGTLLVDAGTPPALFVGDTAALSALPVITALQSPGTIVRVGTYLRSRGSIAQSPPIDYYVDQNICTPDGGSCFTAATTGYYWHITPQAVWDPRWWGAYGDVTVVRSGSIVTTTGSCAVTIPGGPGFDATNHTDDGKYITITNGSNTGAIGASYQGTIASVQDATHITVSAPCPTFTDTPNPSPPPAPIFVQYAYYGHDDSVVWNNTIAYVKTLFARASASGQPSINGGGLSYGVVAAMVNNSGNVEIENVFFAALSAANLPISTTGVFGVTGSYSALNHVTVDSAFLPVNTCFYGVNGTIHTDNVRCLNWQGSGPGFTFTASSLPAAVFTGRIDTCTGTGPYTCVLHVSPILSNGLTGGSLTAGSGYALGDEIILSQTGGSPVQPIAVRVNAINGSGGVTNMNINQGGAYTTNPTGFTQSSTTHNDGTTGAGTGFAITSPTFGSNTIQPGQSVVSDSGSGAQVPAGTYITAFGAPTDVPGGGGIGGTGQYTVMNLTTDPTTSTITMDTLGYDIRVASCSKLLWSDGGAPPTPGVGLVSHGNTGPGILDRTFIVGCPNSRTMVLNRAPTKSFTGQSVTFYQDSNGVYLNNVSGIQISNMTVSQVEQLWIGNINAHFGCSVLSNAPGGTGFFGGATGFGAASNCMGPQGVNNQWRHVVTVGTAGNANNPSDPPDWNTPAYLFMDGANNNLIDDSDWGGQVQVFALVPAPANCTNCQMTITRNAPFNQFTQTEYAPNNTYVFYSEQPTTGTSFLSKWENAQNYNSQANPYDIVFTTGGGPAQSWQSFTQFQIAVMSLSMNVHLSLYNNSQTEFFAGGADLGGFALQRAGCPPLNKTASFTITDNDTGTCFDLTGTGTIAITLPNTLSQNSVLGLNTAAFSAKIFNRTTGGGSASITIASGATLFNAGTSQASPFAMAAGFEYLLDCPRNANGASAVCFISKLAN